MIKKFLTSLAIASFFLFVPTANAALLDFVTSLRNRIVVGANNTAGLIIEISEGISNATHIFRGKNNSDQTTFWITGSGHVAMSGAIRVGNYNLGTGTGAGVIRWNGSDFEGYDGGTWNSFTTGGAGGGTGVSILQENDSTVATGVETLDFLGADFNLTESPLSEVNIEINDAGIDHDSLTNFVANEHIDWTNASQNIETTGNLSGSTLIIQGHATGAHLSITGLVNCDTIDTDSAGNFLCGTDADTQEWIDGGDFFYTNGVKDIVIGGTTKASSDIFLGSGGSAIFNGQGGDVSFVIESDLNANLFITNGASEGSIGLGGLPGTADTITTYMSLIVNEDGDSTNDFRVESDTQTDMLLVDASGNIVSIGGQAGLAEFQVTDGGDVIINDNSTSTTDFRVESDNESNAISLDASLDIVSLMGSINGTSNLQASATGVTINEGSSSAVDFRVESDTNTNQIFVDASANLTEISNLSGSTIESFGLSDCDVTNYFVIWDLTTKRLGCAIVGSASTSNEGIIEIATAAEINTGTDATRAVTPDGLAGSDFGIRYLGGTVIGYTTSVTTGDGKGYIHIPAGMDGMNLVEVHIEVITAGTTGTTDVQIYNVDNALDMLSTKVTIDSAETGSDTAATAYVINTSNDHVNENDMLRIDVDATQTTAPKGLIFTLGFQLP